LALLDTRRCSWRDVHTLGQWNVADVILIDRDKAHEMLRVIHGAAQLRLQELINQFLPRRLSSGGRSIVKAAIEVAMRGSASRDSRELARHLSVSNRSLLRRCESEGLPPPRKLVVWMRVLTAALLLRDTDRSIEGVAFACGYSTDAALRRALYACVGVGPRDLRKDGLRLALDRFRSACVD
jgi:transcriptional regulator GlxA family with amidase domain